MPKWQVMDFKGPGPYTFQAGEVECTVDVDERGYFEADFGSGVPFGIWARLIKSKTQPAIPFNRELAAEDYSYRFPHHWIDHELKTGSLFEKLHAAYASRAIELIKKSGARDVLEIGCGDGWVCNEMSRAGLKAVGVDWSENAISYARMFAQNASFLGGDICDQAISNEFVGKFDAVALIEVIEHIPPADCISALVNISQTLKPGGTLVLTTPSVNLPNTSTLHYRHFTPEILTELVNASDFAVQSIEGYGDVPATDAYWRFMRWVDNEHYTIKAAAKFLTDRYHRTIKLTGTPLDRCQGFIVTAKKP